MGEEFKIGGSEFRHIKLSRKIRKGEQIHVQDSDHRRFACTVTEVKSSFVGLRREGAIDPPAVSELDIRLCVSAVKEKTIDVILRKAVELGVSGIDFLQSEYSNSLPKGEKLTNKLMRWEKIMWESCKQCGRPTPPALGICDGIGSVIDSYPKEKSRVYYLHPTGESISGHDFQVGKDGSILIFVGPEGGFSQKDLLELSSGIALKAGNLIMKTETAVVAAVLAARIGMGDL